LPLNLRNRVVHFRVRDVYIPAAHDVLEALYGGQLLQGRVLDVTPGDADEHGFAVIAVDELPQSLIVPVSRILGAL
jgi:hypothetical protein